MEKIQKIFFSFSRSDITNEERFETISDTERKVFKDCLEPKIPGTEWWG